MNNMKKKNKTVTIEGTRLQINQKDTQYIPNNQPIVGYEEILSRLAYSINKNIPLLMIGETGVGKTALIRHLAYRTNNSFRRLNLNGQTTIDEFVGKILLNKEGTYWVDGILTDAMRKGHWVLLDEINAALPEILFVLHSLLDDDKYVVLSEKDGEIVRPHKNFRIFAAMNPSGKYTGTKDLNKAFLSRFPMILRMDFPKAQQEKQIIRTYAKKVEQVAIDKMVKVANDLRKSYKKNEIEFVCSTRDLINCALIAENRGIKEAVELTMLNRCNEEDFKAVDTVIKLYFGDLKGGAPLPTMPTPIKQVEILKFFKKQLKDFEEFHEEVDVLRDAIKEPTSSKPTLGMSGRMAKAMEFDPIAHEFLMEQLGNIKKITSKIPKK